MKVLVLAVLLTLGLIAAACGSDEAPPAATATSTAPPVAANAREVKVEVKSFSIHPETLNLEPGQRVKFTVSNISSTLHTFTVATTSEKKEILVDLELNGGDSKSQEIIVASNVPTLYYFCRFHESSMEGTFQVGGSTAGDGPGKETPTPDNSGSDYY